mmetsp:Transcript_16168/g.22177  ORF Transcript_16168/g.22177 Transcript_16168/m.22177 type:complete len:116 (-) Transcript_16168:638-985(-)
MSSSLLTATTEPSSISSSPLLTLQPPPSTYSSSTSYVALSQTEQIKRLKKRYGSTIFGTTYAPSTKEENRYLVACSSLGVINVWDLHASTITEEVGGEDAEKIVPKKEETKEWKQ